MKRALFFLLALVIFGTAQAQQDHDGFAKGDMFISGALGYSSVSYPDHSEEQNFTISPRFGYFLNDFIALGARLGYALQDRKNTLGHRVADNSTLTIGVFGRYYLLPGSKFSIYGELGVGFGATKNIADDWTNGVNAWFSPGLSYFVGRHFALEASFGVLSYHTVNAQGVSGSTHSFEAGIDLEDINFGIIYKF